MIELAAVTGLKGKVTVPGDKSISHRCIMFGAIAVVSTVLVAVLYNVLRPVLLKSGLLVVEKKQETAHI